MGEEVGKCRGTMMAAASDTREPTMAKEGLQCVMGREKQNVVPHEEGRDVPHASGSPYMTERPSDELPRSATKPALRTRSRLGTLQPGVVKAPIRQDDKDPFDLQEDHNQWTGEAQNPDQYSEDAEAYKITSIFQMMGFQKLMSPAKIKSSTSVENQGSPKSSESKNSVLVAIVRTNGMASNASDSHDSNAFLPSNDWSVRQDTSSPHAARPSISKNIYSEGTVVNDKKSNNKLKNKQEIQRWPKQWLLPQYKRFPNGERKYRGFFHEDSPNFKGVYCSYEGEAQYDPFGADYFGP